MFRCHTLALAAAAAGLFATGADACDTVYRTSYSVPVTRVVHRVSYPSITLHSRPSISHITHYPPAPAPSSRTEIEVGSTLTANAGFLGADQGFVFLQVGSAKMQCEVVGWDATSVTFRTPNLGLVRRSSAKLEVVRPNGTIARNFRVTLKPRADLVVHEGSALSSAGSLATVAPAAPGIADTAGLSLNGSAGTLTTVSR